MAHIIFKNLFLMTSTCLFGSCSLLGWPTLLTYFDAAGLLAGLTELPGALEALGSLIWLLAWPETLEGAGWFELAGSG